MSLFGLLGERLPHSFSAEIHKKLGRYDYQMFEVPRDGLDAFLRQRAFQGLNVTIPYKEAVLPYLQSCSERAREIGAVNTIVNRDGALFGDNTDFGGLLELVQRMGQDLRGRTVLILGTGGTSKTATAVAKSLGAGAVHRVSRSGREDALTYEQAYAGCADAAFLINTTPCGMYPEPEGIPVDLARFPSLEGVVDVIYNPLTTRLVQQARARGIPAENGLRMLVTQAMLAAERFTDEPVPAETGERIYRELLREKQNIVLIGMPGSGKTTLGRILARRLGRELVDTDRVVVETAGMSIPELFRQGGEPCFRDAETRAVRALSQTGGKVVATGGGVVLRQENVEALKRNGVLLFLDRPPETLVPTADRPLGDSVEKLRALYTARLPLYQAAADQCVPVHGTPEETAEEILRKYNEINCS